MSMYKARRQAAANWASSFLLWYTLGCWNFKGCSHILGEVIAAAAAAQERVGFQQHLAVVHTGVLEFQGVLPHPG
eukprot:1094526-Pelagomonas_calceolata.AAC.1